jgi:hypothetical protein
LEGAEMSNQIKSILNEILSDEYPGTIVKWKKGNPTIIVPDNLLHKQDEIVEFVKGVLLQLGVVVEFYPDKAVLVP